MMRSMFSGVTGLKTHQTKMDVIGNNIANVNTTSFKADSINFSELLYQSQGYASAANVNTGRAGINPKQIGLGVQTAAINKTITAGGAAMTTGIGTDVKINGDAFFIVSPDGATNYFTRDGSFYIDGAGNLATTAGGLNVMGWQVDETTGEIMKDTVSALRVMSAANLQYPPAATEQGYVEGILDRNEPDAVSDSGKILNFSFYDALGYSYTARFSVKEVDKEGNYTVELADILDSNGTSLKKVYNIPDLKDIVSFGGDDSAITPAELTQMMSGVTVSHDTTIVGAAPQNDDYVRADSLGNNMVFLRDVGYTQVVTDFASRKFAGLTYSVKTATNPVKPGDDVVLKGKGAMNKEDLISKGIIQSNDDEDVFFVGDKELKWSEYKDNTGTSRDDWAAALGIDTANGDSLANLEIDTKEGVITLLEVEQTYKVVDDDGKVFTYDNTTGKFTTYIPWNEAYGVDKDANPEEIYPDGQAMISVSRGFEGYKLSFDPEKGTFLSMESSSGSRGNTTLLDFAARAIDRGGNEVDLGAFHDITLDWSNIVWYNNGGASTTTMTAGEEKTGVGAGRRVGNMSGVTISNDGTIYATYDNGMNKLVGQIAVARFANASGLQKAGDNLYTVTANSGTFNGIGEDITQNGTDSMTTGVLEMSNVDLSNEFTHMITTQRGFQANSRVITVSDTLLEELINLKR